MPAWSSSARRFNKDEISTAVMGAGGSPALKLFRAGDVNLASEWWTAPTVLLFGALTGCLHPTAAHGLVQSDHGLMERDLSLGE